MKNVEEVLNEIYFEIQNRCDNETYNYLKSYITAKLYDYRLVKEEKAVIPYEPSQNEQLYKMFMISKKLQGLSDKTLGVYGKEIKKFMNSINKPLNEVTTDDIRYYLACMQLKGTCTNVTIDNTRRFLSTFYNWMEEEEHIKRSPMKKVKKIKSKKEVKKPFTPQEVEVLKMNCKNKMEIAIVEMLFSTGARCNELVNIKIEDINFQENEIKILGKGNKERIVYFNESTKARILDYMKEKKVDSEYLFTKSLYPFTKLGRDRIEVIVRRLGERAGVEKTHPHRFRRTFASTAAKRGMPIEEIQKILGHESLSTTQIYVTVDDDEVKRNHKRLMN